MEVTKREYDEWISNLFKTCYPMKSEEESPFGGRRLVRSKIFEIAVRVDFVSMNYKSVSFPYSIPISYPNSRTIAGAVSLNSLRVISPQYIENAILYTICRTTFSSLQVNRGRYNLDFTKFDLYFIKDLLDFILSSKLKRINYSWVAPLQDLYLSKVHPVKSSKKIKESAWSPGVVTQLERAARLERAVKSHRPSPPQPKKIPIRDRLSMPEFNIILTDASTDYNGPEIVADPVQVDLHDRF